MSWLCHSKLPHTVEGDRVPIAHIENVLGKTVSVSPVSGKGKPIGSTAFPQGPGCTSWVMHKDREVQCVTQGDLILGENSKQIKLNNVNCYITLPLCVITTTVAIRHISGITVRITQIIEE